MQSPSYISSSPSSSSSSDALHHVHLPWKSRSTFPKFKFKTKISCNSLIASYGHGFERIQSGEKPPGKEKLRVSVVISKSGKATRYIWDGTHLLECFDGDSSWSSSNNFNFDDGVRRLYELCKLGIWDFFIPHQVQANYIQYVKWKLLHRVFSSALQVLATQAMFRAMGVGYSRSLTSAAALNWVLKDGLGRLSRCIYTASLASAFDTNLKRVRFSTSVVFSLSMGVELLTPYFPHYFLLLASVANIAKQISLACYLATGSAVHRSFAVADNLGEISAKAQIQTVCFDNLGLMLAALLNILCKNDLRLQAGLPFIVYPMFSGIDLLGIYQGLKHVHLQTLTKERLEIILDAWIQSGIIPSPAEVSKEEGIDFPWTKCRKQWPIKIGCADPKDLLPKFSMLTICSLSNEDFYFIRMETSIRGLARNGQGYIRLCLREGASTTDIIMGLLQACYIRKALLDRKKWEYGVEANDESESVHGAWLKLVEDSKRRSHEKVNLLKEQLQESGWAIKNILLSAEEKARYGLPDN